MTDMTTGRFDELREIVADVLELEPDELSAEGEFVDEYDADSLRAIEILARIEKRYDVEIHQSELPKMHNLQAVYDIVAEHAGW